MAYNVEKLTKLGALKALAQRVEQDYATKQHVTDAVKDKANKATTLAGYGITDAYTKTEVDGKVSSVYKPGGSVAFAALPAADESHLGLVYNVTDAFTTNATFIEGAGKKHPAGTNVVVVSVDGGYKFDVLAGFVDLSGYVEKETGKGLSSNDYTNADKEKLAGVADGANKYVHPTHTSKASGLYKVTVDNEGHVSDAAPVEKADITGLGIPAQDTTYEEATAAAAGLMSAADKAKLNGIDVATDAEVTEMLNEVFGAAV